MSRVRTGAFVLALLFTLTSAPVAWGVATPTTMERLVLGVRDEGDFASESSTTAGVFDEEVFSSTELVAFQSSQIQPSFFGGFGAASIGGIAEVARAVFDVTFALAVPHNFVLDGGVFADASTAEGFFSLIGPGTSLVFSDVPDDLSDPTQFSQTGVLAPGSYHLFVIASSVESSNSGVSFASWAFTLELTDPNAVPEPLTSTLLALGAAALAWQRTRRKR